ncbi:MAG: cache domain-containing protein [Phycisphaerales bacterium]|nr:MAG: cache domain-containing protein [Phycisphaerales bacterium]
MKARKLKTRIWISFYWIIVVFAVSIALLEYYVIENDIIKRTQARVRNDLNSAREIYRGQVERVRDAVRFTALRFFVEDAISAGRPETLTQELERIRIAESLDMLTLTDRVGDVVVRSRNPSVDGDSQANDLLVRLVLSSGEVVSGTAIVQKQELLKEGSDLAEQAHIKLVPTPKARPSAKAEETSGMMIKAAAPIFAGDGELIGVLYGGKLLNRDYEIVDRVKDTVYEGAKYKGKDIGTATIFQRDLRISTNVRAKDRGRAIGTRVSEEVYDRVLAKGLPWVDRAFVVTDWYRTAYEPIRDIDGQVIGILYVGILEQPFVDRGRNIFFVFLGIVVVATVLAGLLASVLAGAISRPVKHMLKATERLSEGALGYEVDAQTGTAELNVLADSFNEMSERLKEREQSLSTSNEKLAALNKTYLDLVGFVSHELKGTIGIAIMSVASVRDGLFGQIDAKQKEALCLATRNLKYLTETVRKFLDLSRIEKGELNLNPTSVSLREDIFDGCLETFAGEAAEKKMQVSNNIQPQIRIEGDRDLLRIVANNLVGNAVKYGLDGGNVVLNSEDLGQAVRIEVYNDSRPITEEEKARLFKKFSRLEIPERQVKGTGLGLFITREIIMKHAGDIWVEPRENGNSFVFRIPKAFSKDAPAQG